MQRKFFSVVFEVLDDDKFRETMAGFTQQLGSAGVRNGAQVIGCGQGDSMAKAAAFQDRIAEYGYDPVEVIYDYLEAQLEDGCNPLIARPGLEQLVKDVIG